MRQSFLLFLFHCQCLWKQTPLQFLGACFLAKDDKMVLPRRCHSQIVRSTVNDSCFVPCLHSWSKQEKTQLCQTSQAVVTSTCMNQSVLVQRSCVDSAKTPAVGQHSRQPLASRLSLWWPIARVIQLALPSLQSRFPDALTALLMYIIFFAGFIREALERTCPLMLVAHGCSWWNISVWSCSWGMSFSVEVNGDPTQARAPAYTTDEP